VAFFFFSLVHLPTLFEKSHVADKMRNSESGVYKSAEKNTGFRSPEWQSAPKSLARHSTPNRPSSKDNDRYTRFSNDVGSARPSEIARQNKTSSLAISFCAMIVIGSGNKIFQKLQTVPMYNYPNFLNLLTTFMYIPLSFSYIIPVAKFGWMNGSITKEQLDLPKKPFAIMGFLDCLAGIMQVFSATYLPGPLLILLSQSAIPISMMLSKNMLGAKYAPYQFVGAFVVIVGLVTVLAPVLNNSSDESCTYQDNFEDECSECQGMDNSTACAKLNIDGTSICKWEVEKSNAGTTLTWAGVMCLSCVPMCLSSIYKEIALGETELDPVFLNGWIALFQFAFSIPLAIPAALAGDPSIVPSDLPQNLWDGLKCYLGIGSIFSGCHLDDLCETQSIPFVNTYLLFNVSYNILIILILKFGSANILWLAMTVMVPIGNLSFALPFMPDPSTFKPTDIVGLCVIMGGLCLYRFGESAWNRFFGYEELEDEEEDLDREREGNKPLLSPFSEHDDASTPGGFRRSRAESEDPELVGGVGRVGKSF